MMNFFSKYVGIKNFIFFVLAILFILFIAQIKDIAILFFAAFVISCSLNPIVDVICEKQKNISRPIASAIVLLGVLLIGLIFFIPIIITGGQQIGSFIDSFPEWFEHTKSFLTSIPLLKNTSINDIDIGGLVTSVSGFTSDIVSQSITFSKGIATFFIYLLSACIIIYYFMADKETVKKGYLSLFPHDLKQKADEIIESISEKVGGYVLAQVVTIISLGIIVLIGLLILGVDYALILGLITAIFDLVPVIGPAIALIIILIAVCKLGVLKIIFVGMNMKFISFFT